MPSPDDLGEKKTSRRRYIKLVATLVTVGVVGIVLGDVAGPLQSGKAEKATDPASKISTTTRTATETQTLTDTKSIAFPPITSTLTDAVTKTQTDTETNTLTSTQTVTTTVTTTEIPPTQTVTNIQTETEIATPSATSSSSSTSTTTYQTATKAGDFSIFWITDTQFLSESNPALFEKLTNWIVSNWDLYNGKMVIHTGDIVQTGAHEVEWESANKAMSILLKNRIPYTWCAGNHDDLAGGEPTSGWIGNIRATAFDPSFVSSQVNALQYASWVSNYHDGMNTAASFSANGLDFLIVSIEWNAQDDVLKWVEGLLDDPAYADYRVVIAPHAYIDAFGSILDWSNYSDLTSFVNGLTALMDRHSSNVFMTLNGHYATDFGFRTLDPINGRNELMFDRQDSTDDAAHPMATPTTPDVKKLGGATATILTFDTVNNQIHVSTYDVNAGTWRDDPYERYSVTMFPAPPPNKITNANGSGGLLTATH